MTDKFFDIRVRIVRPIRATKQVTLEVAVNGDRDLIYGEINIDTTTLFVRDGVHTHQLPHVYTNIDYFTPSVLMIKKAIRQHLRRHHVDVN